MFNNPTTDDFKTYFSRDFPYGTTKDKVKDEDLMKCFSDADVNISQALFANQASYNVGFLNLAAHYLVTNIRASSQGLSGQYSWLQGSRGVGSVSESISIPQRILDNPYLAMISNTYYGAKYIAMILPQLCGQTLIIGGATLA